MNPLQSGVTAADLVRVHARLAGLRSWLLAKQQRERAYLDRRAAQGVHTSTDAAYEYDQQREADMLALLDELLANVALLEQEVNG